MLCVGCNGTGCDLCGETGEQLIECCPLELIGGDIFEVIEYAELWEKGLPPVAGGALDQTKSFVVAARFIMAERNFWKKKMKLL